MKKVIALVLILALLPALVLAELPKNEAVAVDTFFELLDDFGVIVTSNDCAIEPGPTEDINTSISYAYNPTSGVSLSITYYGSELRSHVVFIDTSDSYAEQKAEQIMLCTIAAFTGLDEDKAMDALTYLMNTTEDAGPLGVEARLVRGEYELLFGVSVFGTASICVYPAN